MTYIRRILLNGGVVLALSLVAPGIAAACGCMNSRSFSMSQDDVNVYATATMNVSYLCQAEVTATITAPDNSTATDDTGVVGGGGDVTASSIMSIGNLAGQYNGQGTYWRDGSDSELHDGPGYFGPMQSSQQVAPFARITSASLSQSSISRQNGGTTYTAAVYASAGCGGNIQVAYGITPPNGMDITVSPNTVNNTAHITNAVAAEGSANYQFTIATGGGNTVTGSVATVGYISILPMGCTDKTNVPTNPAVTVSN